MLFTELWVMHVLVEKLTLLEKKQKHQEPSLSSYSQSQSLKDIFVENVNQFHGLSLSWC